jgi:hypothetical protein
MDEVSAPGRRLGQIACVVGLAYAAVSVYWAAGGTWLLSTVGAGLGKPGQADGTLIVVAVWAAAVLKLAAAILPLTATGRPSGQAAAVRRSRLRLLAWAEAVILTGYGLVLTAAGLLVQTGLVASAAGADHQALAWHAYLWDPWFLLWGVLVAAALVRSGHPRWRAAECGTAR